MRARRRLRFRSGPARLLPPQRPAVRSLEILRTSEPAQPRSRRSAWAGNPHQDRPKPCFRPFSDRGRDQGRQSPFTAGDRGRPEPARYSDSTRRMLVGYTDQAGAGESMRPRRSSPSLWCSQNAPACDTITAVCGPILRAGFSGCRSIRTLHRGRSLGRTGSHEPCRRGLALRDAST